MGDIQYKFQEKWQEESDIMENKRNKKLMSLKETLRYLGAPANAESRILAYLTKESHTKRFSPVTMHGWAGAYHDNFVLMLQVRHPYLDDSNVQIYGEWRIQRDGRCRSFNDGDAMLLKAGKDGVFLYRYSDAKGSYLQKL